MEYNNNKYQEQEYNERYEEYLLALKRSGYEKCG